ncbi:MAG: hypothetical protein WAK42_07360, partial [Mycobacterium sp.]
MTRPFNIDQWLYQIEHFYQSRIIEPPHNSVRLQFDISRTVLPHYLMFYCVGFEGRCAVFMCRSHRGLKHSHSVSICVYQDGWDADILERLDTEGGHSGLFRWWKIAYVQATGRVDVLLWCFSDGADECVVDGAAEFGGVIVQAGLAVRHYEHSVLNKQSLCVVASDVSAVLSPDALLVGESEVSAASYRGHHRRVCWCLQGVNGDVLGAAHTQIAVNIGPDDVVRGNAFEAEHIDGFARVPACEVITAVNGRSGGLDGAVLRASDLPARRNRQRGQPRRQFVWADEFQFGDVAADHVSDVATAGRWLWAGWSHGLILFEDQRKPGQNARDPGHPCR